MLVEVVVAEIVAERLAVELRSAFTVTTTNAGHWKPSAVAIHSFTSVNEHQLVLPHSNSLSDSYTSPVAYFTKTAHSDVKVKSAATIVPLDVLIGHILNNSKVNSGPSGSFLAFQLLRNFEYGALAESFAGGLAKECCVGSNDSGFA
mgnify:CR=1 FL=1